MVRTEIGDIDLYIEEFVNRVRLLFEGVFEVAEDYVGDQMVKLSNFVDEVKKSVVRNRLRGKLRNEEEAA